MDNSCKWNDKFDYWICLCKWNKCFWAEYRYYKITSTDSITWYAQPGKNNVIGMTAGATVFVDAGVNGVLETSNTTYPYNPATQFQIPTDAAINGQLTV